MTWDCFLFLCLCCGCLLASGVSSEFLLSSPTVLARQPQKSWWTLAIDAHSSKWDCCHLLSFSPHNTTANTVVLVMESHLSTHCTFRHIHQTREHHERMTPHCHGCVITILCVRQFQVRPLAKQLTQDFFQKHAMSMMAFHCFNFMLPFKSISISAIVFCFYVINFSKTYCSINCNTGHMCNVRSRFHSAGCVKAPQ